MAGNVIALRVRKVQEKGYRLTDQIMLVVGEGIAGEKAQKGKSAVSLFFQKKPEKQPGNRGLCSGRFWENVTLSGLNPEMVQIGTELFLGEALIRIVEKKHCFPECRLAVQEKPCALRSQAMFAEVLKSGAVKVGAPCGLADQEGALDEKEGSGCTSCADR